jgi:hypothetical protein
VIEEVHPITDIYNPAIRVLEVATSAAELHFGKEFADVSAAELHFGKEFADVSHGCKF